MKACIKRVAKWVWRRENGFEKHSEFQLVFENYFILFTKRDVLPESNTTILHENKGRKCIDFKRNPPYKKVNKLLKIGKAFIIILRNRISIHFISFKSFIFSCLKYCKYNLILRIIHTYPEARMESVLLFFSTPIKHTSKMLYMGCQLIVNGTFFS